VYAEKQPVSIEVYQSHAVSLWSRYTLAGTQYLLCINAALQSVGLRHRAYTTIALRLRPIQTVYQQGVLYNSNAQGGFAQINCIHEQPTLGLYGNSTPAPVKILAGFSDL